MNAKEEKAQNLELKIYKKNIINFFLKHIKPCCKNLDLSYKNLKTNIDFLDLAKNEFYEILASDKIKPYVVSYLAFKYLMLEKNNIKIKKIYIIKIFENYQKSQDDTFFEQLEIVNLTKEVTAKLPSVALELAHMTSYEFNKSLNKSCFKPEICEFFGECWNDVGDVSSISMMPASQKIELINKGFKSISDVPDELLDDRQVFYKKNKNEILIDKKKLKEFLHSIGNHVYFLDFETYQPILPTINGKKSYESVVFGFSLYEINAKKEKFYQYMGNILTKDTRKIIAKKLSKIIKKDTKILAYGSGLEKKILKEFCLEYPEKRHIFENMLENIVDLGLVFKTACFVGQTLGSASLKAVSNALLDNIYSKLEISNAQEIVREYRRFLYQKNTKKIKQNILAYSKTDTKTMLMLYKKLLQWSL